MVDQFQEFGNPDPSRAVTTFGNDRLAGGRDGPSAPRGSADDADWPPDAVGDVTGAGTPRCSNADRDRSRGRPRRSTDDRACGADDIKQLYAGRYSENYVFR